MMSVNLSNTVVLKSNGLIYQCIINGISKNEAISLLKNVDLTVNLSDIVVLKINDVIYQFIINGSSRNEATSLLKIVNLTVKSKT